MCWHRTGISSGQPDFFSIKNDRERALKRNKDLFVVESMGVACRSWVNLELPGAEFCCATTWGGEPKKVQSTEVKAWGLCRACNGHELFSFFHLTRTSSCDIVNESYYVDIVNQGY